MIDIHTHILPALDDGSDSMEESLEMAEMAVRGGKRIVAATPHCNVRGRFENYEDSGERLEVFRQFRKLLEEEGIPLRVAQGMEIYGVGDIRALIQQRRLISLNHSGNYLIEFPFDMHPDEIADGLYMVFEAGGVPVLAHPERYYCVQDTPNLVYHWMHEGVLTQINMGSFLGAFGRREERTAVALLEHGLITCLASDCHGTRWRSPDMRRARDYIRERIARETADLLFHENPRAILAGEKVRREPMREIRERRRFFS